MKKTKPVGKTFVKKFTKENDHPFNPSFMIVHHKGHQAGIDILVGG